MTLRSSSQVSKADRDARLDALDAAVREWGAKEKARLEDEVTFLKSVLKSRSGAGKLAGKNVEDAEFYLIDKISRFLEG
jgi:hypothetical protein